MTDYGAGLPWRDKVSARFVQYLAAYDPEAFQQLTVDVAFDNGLTLRCQTLFHGQEAMGCFDLGSNYREAAAQFITRGSAACNDCTIAVQAPAADWQARQGDKSVDPRQISVVHHSGSIVTVHVGLGGGKEVQCLFAGVDPVMLQTCFGGM